MDGATCSDESSMPTSLESELDSSSSRFSSSVSALLLVLLLVASGVDSPAAAEPVTETDAAIVDGVACAAAVATDGGDGTDERLPDDERDSVGEGDFAGPACVGKDSDNKTKIQISSYFCFDCC